MYNFREILKILSSTKYLLFLPIPFILIQENFKPSASFTFSFFCTLFRLFIHNNFKHFSKLRIIQHSLPSQCTPFLNPRGKWAPFHQFLFISSDASWNVIKTFAVHPCAPVRRIHNKNMTYHRRYWASGPFHSPVFGDIQVAVQR